MALFIALAACSQLDSSQPAHDKVNKKSLRNEQHKKRYEITAKKAQEVRPAQSLDAVEIEEVSNSHFCGAHGSILEATAEEEPGAQPEHKERAKSKRNRSCCCWK